MTLPNDPTVAEVAEDNDLSLLDEKILTVLREADAPVLTSKEVKKQGIRKSRRTVHDHLEDLEQLGLVRHKRAGDGDRTPKVWWFNEEAVDTADEPPGDDLVREGLEAMPAHKRRSLRTDFPEFANETPRLLRWSVGGVILGPVLLLMLLPLNVLRSDMGIEVLPSADVVTLFAGLSTLAGLVGLAFYAFGAVEIRLRENDRFGSLPPKILNKNKYALGFGIVLFFVAILIEGIPVLGNVSELTLVGSLLTITLSLVIAFVAWLADLITTNRQYFESPASS